MSRGLGDVYKRQVRYDDKEIFRHYVCGFGKACLLYTSDAADELDGVDLGGRRIIKKIGLGL
ncbi:hypothetical protein JMUB7556_28280 [Staphylococcus aureus]